MNLWIRFGDLYASNPPEMLLFSFVLLTAGMLFGMLLSDVQEMVDVR